MMRSVVTKIVSLALLYRAVIVVHAEGDYMTADMTPTLGPEMDTVYQPGTPGGQWTDEQISTTRHRVFQMIHPDWQVKKDMGIADSTLGRNNKGYPGQCTENTLLRLAFHDCIPYVDGTGGCDGCLNWKGMYTETPNPNDASHKYKFGPTNATDNKGLDGLVERLELIYTTIDWPFQSPSLTVSLYQSGISRADLWQFAGLVALEQALERANRACDLDFHARQQVHSIDTLETLSSNICQTYKGDTTRKP